MKRFNFGGINKIKCTPKEHFEKKFRVTPGCWIWTAGKDKGGYGQFYDGQRSYRSNRYAWLLYYGEIPNGLLVCHRCDTPSCVNPDHLFLGTHRENAEDRTQKGRGAKNFGTAQGTSKLTDLEVIKIRSMAGKQKDIAALFGVHQSLISYIKSGKIWPHLLENKLDADA